MPCSLKLPDLRNLYMKRLAMNISVDLSDRRGQWKDQCLLVAEVEDVGPVGTAVHDYWHPLRQHKGCKFCLNFSLMVNSFNTFTEKRTLHSTHWSRFTRGLNKPRCALGLKLTCNAQTVLKAQGTLIILGSRILPIDFRSNATARHKLN